MFGGYLLLSGAARFLVEFLRVNEPVLLGLTQPQLWAVVGGVVGVLLMALGARRKDLVPERGAVGRMAGSEPVAPSAA